MTTQLHTRTLTAEDQRILGKLLVEALSGEVTDETRDELDKLGDYGELPAPFGHIVGYVGGYGGSGKEVAVMVVDEIRIFRLEQIEELKQKHSQ